MIIDDIIESTKERVAENKKLHSIEKIAKLAFDKPINFDYPFEKALRKPGLSYIYGSKKSNTNKRTNYAKF